MPTYYETPDHRLRKASTNLVNVYLVDATNGYDEEVSILAPTIQIKTTAGWGAANDGAWAECGGAGNGAGWYTVRLDSTDTATTGPLHLRVVKTGTTRVFPQTLWVMEAADYDREYLGTGTQAVNVTQWNSESVASPDAAGYPVVTVKDGQGQGEILTQDGSISQVSGVEAVIGFAQGAFTGYAATEIADSVWNDDNSIRVTPNTAGVALNTVNANSASASTIADAVLDEPLSEHTTSGTTGATLTSISTNVSSVLNNEQAFSNDVGQVITT